MTGTARLELDRAAILAQRRRATSLDRRLPPGPGSVRAAAVAGFSDSMPRAALLSLHARVEGIASGALGSPELVQVWGPRFSAYVIAAEDRAWFTMGRLPEGGPRRTRAEETAERLCAHEPEHEPESARRGKPQPGQVERAVGPTTLRQSARGERDQDRPEHRVLGDRGVCPFVNRVDLADGALNRPGQGIVVLAQSPGRVLSRDQIMDALKGHPLEAFDRSIDVHISRIRAVIEDDAKNPKRVLTVRGAGYVFAKKQDADG